MVNKVDGNSYYVYTNPKKVDIPDTGEKFSLGYEKDGLQAGLKDKKEVADQEGQQAAERSGVRLELSGKGMERQKQAEAVERPNATGLTSLFETIRTFLTTTVAAIKDIFSKIWNDPKQEDALKDISDSTETADIADALKGVETTGVMGDMQSAETAGVIRVTESMDTTGATEDKTASRADEENSDREIRRHLQNGDVEQVIRLLTDNGRKTAARNSTLLTFYDKNGRVVKPDASVQQRTLYGDKNTQRL